MARSLTLNAVSYSIPQTGDSGWSLTGGVDDYLVALSTGVLTKSGGTFTLTAEVNFGATYGLKTAYYKSQTANSAATGAVRLANTDTVSWRNAANGADLALAVNASNAIQFNAISLADLSTAQTLTNKTLTTPIISSISNTGTLTLPAATDTLVGRATTDTLTNKTLTSAALTTPTVTGGTLTGITGLGFRDTSNPYDVTPVFTSVSPLTAGRTLTIDMENGSRSIKFLGNLSLGSDFTTNGGAALTLYNLNPVTLTMPLNSSTLATLAGAETFTNKTLTAPVISSISNTGTLTLPTSTDTLVGRATTDTLSNKTLTAPTITGGAASALTGLAVRDTSAAFDVTVAGTSSTALTAGRTLTIDMVNAANTIKIPPLANFSGLADGAAGTVLSTLGSGTGYSWASALTSTLNQYSVSVGNSSNAATSTNTNLLGDIQASTLSQTYTVTSAAPGVFTVASTANMTTGQTAYVTATQNGFTLNTTYYLYVVSGTTFQLCSSYVNAIAHSGMASSGTVSGTVITGGFNVTQQRVFDSGSKMIAAGDMTEGGVNGTATRLPIGTANQLLGVTNAATAHEYKTIAIGTAGSDLSIANTANTITLNLPDASATARGAITTGAQTLAGAKTFSGQLIGKGTATNDNAAAGYIGEYLANVQSTGSPNWTTGVECSIDSGNVTLNDGLESGITLSAGDWDISATAYVVCSGAVTQIAVYVGTAKGNNASGQNLAQSYMSWSGAALSAPAISFAIPAYRISLATPATYYLKGDATFSTGSVSARGRISARRVR